MAGAKQCIHAELSIIEAKQIAFVIFHISKSIKPKILKILPDITHYKE
jgi:hypothetical protein